MKNFSPLLPICLNMNADSRYSRLVGGTGAAAYGAHEHSQRHEPTTSTTAGTTAGTHSSNIANRADPTIDSDRSKNLHYGRDAALVGGAGMEISL